MACSRSQMIDHGRVLRRGIAIFAGQKIAGDYLDLRAVVAPGDRFDPARVAGGPGETAQIAHAAVQQIDPQLVPDLKWPNDLLIEGKKFCGILTEMNAEVTRVRYIVVGVGINVNQEKFPDDLRQSATSLRLATGTEWSRVELFAALLKSLDREYRDLLHNPAARESILKRFQERSSSIRGRQVQVEENGGFEGVSAGLDQRGFLQVQSAQGVRTVLSGTVRLK